MTATISPQELQPKLTADSSLKLIDVRSPSEYQQVHAVGAISVPLTGFNAAKVIKEHGLTNDQPVYLICKMGGRSLKACLLLQGAGLTSAVNVTGGTDLWVADQLPAVNTDTKSFAIHRQVQLLAGSLAFTGAVLSFWNPLFALLAAFIGAGLMFSGITNTCGMGTMLGKMPWNRG